MTIIDESASHNCHRSKQQPLPMVKYSSMNEQICWQPTSAPKQCCCFNFRQQCLHILVLTVSSVFIHNLTKNSTNLTATHTQLLFLVWFGFFVALAVVVWLFFSKFCFLSLTVTTTKMYQYYYAVLHVFLPSPPLPHLQQAWTTLVKTGCGGSWNWKQDWIVGLFRSHKKNFLNGSGITNGNLKDQNTYMPVLF